MARSTGDDVLTQLRDDLAAAAAAPKCHRCGCLGDAVDALEASALAEPLAESLASARRVIGEAHYDCLGCPRCWPADALNRAAEVTELPAHAGCPTDAPERRAGWPPYPGAYRALRYSAPVAICTLHSLELVDALAEAAPEGLSIVGALQTENLGIERVIENVVANPHLRVLLICGEDTPGRVGHLPGQSLLALLENGIDERARIVGAAGKRPRLQNLDRDLVDHFRRQVRPLDRRGLGDVAAIASLVEPAAASAPEPLEAPPPVARPVRVIEATPPERLELDRAGYVVVVPDRRRSLLVAEHFENDGSLRAVVEGRSGPEIVATLLREGLVSRADHAAYLGRELARAERALRDGTPYVQDAAPPEPSSDEPAPASSSGCGCATGPSSA